jgi:hypothetical protein
MEKEAEFSPWLMIFKRIEAVCDLITTTFIRHEYKQTLDLLEELYINLYPLMNKSQREMVEEHLNSTRKKLALGIPIRNDIIQIRKMLYEIKQQIGLGIPLAPKLDVSKKLKSVLL